MVVVNRIQTVSSNFPVSNQGGGQNNIESICVGWIILSPLNIFISTWPYHTKAGKPKSSLHGASK